ncbi:MAG: hypothetical protein GX941_09315 [Candidatus Methanofastidiosa archaeon]|nr:hypothetical protein [Candidatus Methanofastidiosa archaeon]NMA31984.1 hypothetical protein [Candidatus Methanofastidiosa archaeon]
MILSGEELLERIKEDDIFRRNKNIWENFYGWHFDLRLGDEVFITRRDEPIKLQDGKEFVSISPGEFALLITEEEIKMPADLMAFINVRFSYKQKGLINISGFHVDPCYEGKLIFSVFNAGPNDIILRKSEPVFMIFFSKLTDDISKFQDALSDESKEDYFLGLVGNTAYLNIKNKNLKKKGFTKIPSDMMLSIKGISVSLAENNSRIERLENSIKIYGSIAVGVIVALIGLILSF